MRWLAVTVIVSVLVSGCGGVLSRECDDRYPIDLVDEFRVTLSLEHLGYGGSHVAVLGSGLAGFPTLHVGPAEPDGRFDEDELEPVSTPPILSGSVAWDPSRELFVVGIMSSSFEPSQLLLVDPREREVVDFLTLPGHLRGPLSYDGVADRFVVAMQEVSSFDRPRYLYVGDVLSGGVDMLAVDRDPAVEDNFTDSLPVSLGDGSVLFRRSRRIVVPPRDVSLWWIPEFGAAPVEVVAPDAVLTHVAYSPAVDAVVVAGFFEGDGRRVVWSVELAGRTPGEWTLDDWVEVEDRSVFDLVASVEGVVMTVEEGPGAGSVISLYGACP